MKKKKKLRKMTFLDAVTGFSAKLNGRSKATDLDRSRVLFACQQDTVRLDVLVDNVITVTISNSL